MEYPVYIEGRKCGSLTASAEGLMTVMSAKCAFAPRKPVRLYLYGGGESALLGTLQPAGGGMTLHRKFSRGDMEKLPKAIEYAADAPIVPACQAADTVWRRGRMGCLVSKNALAIPADAHRLGRVSDKLRHIDGMTYIIFERNL